MNEYLELHNNRREKIGKKIIRFKENQGSFYHEAINLYVLNEEEKLLIQKRSKNHPVVLVNGPLLSELLHREKMD